MVLSNGEAKEDHDPIVLPKVTSNWIKRVLFTGTGTSGQVPAAGCLLRDPESTTSPCTACFDAMQKGSKNRRGCTSAAIVGGSSPPRGEEGEEESLLLIDCGPTFYSSALDHFPAQKLRKIDAVLLTHAHADAILGLDNLRSWTMGGVIQDRVDIYCTNECFETVRGMFPYLADPSRSTGGGGVGDVKFHIIDAQKPFRVPLFSGDTIEVIPLPVHHGRVQGRPFECLGFRVDSFSYISDCHFIPSKTANLMTGSQVIVLDALNPYRHASHFSLAQALSFTLSMPGSAPKLSLLTDLTHNLEHYQTERAVQSWRKEMQAWKHKLHRLGSVNSSIDQLGSGEGGGSRWWKGIWDETKSEKARRGIVDLSLTSKANAIGSGEEDIDDIPSIHVTWDGMVINFEKEQ